MYREFLILIAASCVFASPIAYYLFNQWLNSFAYHVDIGIMTFVIAVTFISFIALITVGYQSISAARANPVKVLRSEEESESPESRKVRKWERRCELHPLLLFLLTISIYST